MEQSLLTPSSSSNKAPTLLQDTNRISQLSGWRMRKGIRRRKVVCLVHKGTVAKASRSSDQLFSSEESSSLEINSVLQGFSTRHDGQSENHGMEDCHSTNISHKYQPKHLKDIIGQEFIVKAISIAVQYKKVAHLYLFCGSSGTGKTTTARIFGRALNCESISPNKPCWRCRGCSRSLYFVYLGLDLDSGFQSINTHLHNLQAGPGFKVIIIEECHSLTAREWNKLMHMIERSSSSSLVFILISDNTTVIPRNILSRCQKFSFPKLKDMDIEKKLTRIIAHEKFEIEREGLKLIVAKAEGSLREAENILDQLSLQGTRITSSMVQQVVGLAPQDKLINLITAAISGDARGAIISTKQLIAEGVEAHALGSQLISLIIDILSSPDLFNPNSSPYHGPQNENGLFSVPDCSLSAGSSKAKNLWDSGSLLINQSEQLYCALKILVEYEKQLQYSLSQKTWIFKALLQIASQDISNRASPGNLLFRDIIYSGEHSSSCLDNLSSNKTDTIRNQPCVKDMEQIWLHILEKVHSKHMKGFLRCQVKLASFTVSNASVMVHLIFKRPEDKTAAQISEESISNALKNAIGCPVTINMGIGPVEFEIIGDTVATYKTLGAECGHSEQHLRAPFPKKFVCDRNCESTTSQRIHPGSSSLLSNNLWLSKLKDCTPISQEQETCPTGELRRLPLLGAFLEENRIDVTGDPNTHSLTTKLSIEQDNILTPEKTKHRWLSLSSIQHSDACVEPYSQDILFENANIEKDGRGRKNINLQRRSFEAYEDHHVQDSTRSIGGPYRSWSCKGKLCQRKPKENKHAA